MSSYRWEIAIPHYSRSDPLTLAASLARHLPDTDDQRAVTRQILFNAMEHGMRTVDGLLTYLETASPADRRLLIDEARAQLGLESTAMIDAAEAFRRSSHGDTQIVVNGRWVGG